MILSQSTGTDNHCLGGNEGGVKVVQLPFFHTCFLRDAQKVTLIAVVRTMQLWPVACLGRTTCVIIKSLGIRFHMYATGLLKKCDLFSKLDRVFQAQSDASPCKSMGTFGNAARGRTRWLVNYIKGFH